MVKDATDPSDSEQLVLDPKSLRGLAHPLRVRILGLLRIDGPSTATKLAERLGQSSGATSYHLRQLATYGFVVEDPERTGPGRERWWKALSHSTHLPWATARESSADAEGYLRSIATWHYRQVETFLSELATIPAAWDEGWALSDSLLRLTPAEAKRLLRELRGVVRRYRADDPDTEAPKNAERVWIQLQLLPRFGPSAAAP
ncbi:MAG: ArsR/SmtB family transcription factor [Acidimicrobiales bacterium]